MEKQLRIGDLVIALREIREIDDLVDVVHARPGDMGMVVGLENSCFPTVQFGESATDCHLQREIALLRDVDITVRKLSHA